MKISSLRKLLETIETVIGDADILFDCRECGELFEIDRFSVDIRSDDTRVVLS